MREREREGGYRQKQRRGDHQGHHRKIQEHLQSQCLHHTLLQVPPLLNKSQRKITISRRRCFVLTKKKKEKRVVYSWNKRRRVFTCIFCILCRTLSIAFVATPHSLPCIASVSVSPHTTKKKKKLYRSNHNLLIIKRMNSLKKIKRATKNISNGSSSSNQSSSSSSSSSDWNKFINKKLTRERDYRESSFTLCLCWWVESIKDQETETIETFLRKLKY